jgi:hypothetical protein
MKILQVRQVDNSNNIATESKTTADANPNQSLDTMTLTRQRRKLPSSKHPTSKLTKRLALHNVYPSIQTGRRSKPLGVTITLIIIKS